MIKRIAVEHGHLIKKIQYLSVSIKVIRVIKVIYTLFLSFFPAGDPCQKRWSPLGISQKRLAEFPSFFDLQSGDFPNPPVFSIPIGSMYGIYANIWGILMVNVVNVTIYGSTMDPMG